ncbi:MAG: hypothetical protein CAF43_002830 [Nitrospira sp. CG24C]|nr:MAG: hypothetical protein CAF43_002830 [Nitrospira sp. CG24C]
MNRYQYNLTQWLAWSLRALLLTAIVTIVAGCASQPVSSGRTILDAGLNTVRLEQDPDSVSNAHPATLTPAEVGTLLRGVRASERRNIVHRLIFGQADQTRAFRKEEISVLAVPLSTALSLAEPTERVYFNLSHATDQGDQETTTGWVSIQGPILHLIISDVHARHSPGPDISKYDRQLPNIPEASALYDVIFEPEEFLAKASSTTRFWAPDQREELQIRYQEALAGLTVQPAPERDGKKTPPQP